MFKPILLLFTIIVSVGFAFLNVKPAYEQSRSRLSDLEMLNTIFKKTDSIRETINQTKRIMEEITPAEYARFNTFLPEKMDEIRFVNNLTEMARTRNILLKDVKIGEGNKASNGSSATDVPVTMGRRNAMLAEIQQSESGSVPERKNMEEKYKKITVAFSFVTSYPMTKLFIGDMGKSLSTININEFSFEEYKVPTSSKEVKEADLLYRSTMEVETYALK